MLRGVLKCINRRTAYVERKNPDREFASTIIRWGLRTTSILPLNQLSHVE